MTESKSIIEAIQQIQDIINKNPSEQSGIYERLYSLCSILQYPSRVLPDGTSLNFLPSKNDKITKNTNNEINSLNQANPNSSSEKNKQSNINSEFSRRNANELERKRVSNRLNGFSLKNSVAWQEICRRFGPNLNQSELLSMAEVISQQAGLKVDREAKRRKEVLIKWYDENIVVVQRMLPYFKLEDAEGNVLKGDDDQYVTNRNDDDSNASDNIESNNDENNNDSDAD